MASIIPRTSGPSVQLQQGPQVRGTTFVDPSAGIEAVQGVAKVAQSYLAQKQEENDLTAVMQARRELSDWESQAFDPSNPEGIAKYQGKNALGAKDALVPALDSRVGEISGRLSPRQRAQFDQVATNFRDQLQGRLNGYADREHSAYMDGEQKATLEVLGQDAVAAAMAGDFTRQDAIANELLQVNRAHLQTKGMGEELIKASERGIVSSVRTQTIDGMATTRPFEAQAYFERYADQMTPEDRAKVERVLYPVVMDAELEVGVAAIINGGSPSEAVDVASGDVDSMIVDLETGGNDKAKNPTSSATGAGQFLDSTWLSTIKAHKPELARGKTNEELLGMRTDGKLAREMVTAYRQDNARALTARGVPATAVNLYAAHHFGPGGAVKFANLPDSAPMSKVLSPRELAANKYLQGKTVGDVKANWAKRGMKDGGGSAGSEAAPGRAAAPTGPRTEAEALAVSRETYRDPRQRAAADSKIRAHFQLEDARTAEREKAMSEHTYTSINQGDPRLSLRAMIGADAYAYQERKGNIPALENQRKAKLLGTLTQDDVVMVDALQREAALSPGTFMKRDLHDPKVSGRLSTDTMAGLLKMQADAKKPEKQAEWATQGERIDSGLRILGLDAGRDPSGSGSADKKAEAAGKRAAFGTVYREAERAFVQRTGKAPDPAQADVLVREVTRRVADNPWMLEKNADGSRRSSALEGYGAAMSDAVRQEAIASYRSKYGDNVTPTEAQIVQYAVLKSKQAK